MAAMSESCGISTGPTQADSLAHQIRRADLATRISLNSSQINLLEKCQRALETRQHELTTQLSALINTGRQLDTEHHHLTRQRRDLEDALNRVTGFPCTIPSEITSLIFLYCVGHFSGPFLPSNATLFLAHVCRKWREIAFATCWLWTSLRMDFDGARRDISNDDAYAFLHSWIGQAKGQPLSLSFSSSTAIPPAIFPLIAIHSQQLWALNVSLVSADAHVFNHILGPFPLLTHLTIFQHLTNPVVIFNDAPELRYLNMFNHSVFPSLTQLNLLTISVSQFYEVLLSCPQLKHLSTSLEGGMPDSPRPVHITSPHLEDLLLNANTGEYGRIFDSLTFPQLHTLQPVDNVPCDVF
ncbi:hypothetical protein C8J57DRAFT_1572143 [Mycena rebaudengoi]|nr:hypothetical protein C8J57DRAFT_1572143 [Mycena rebaudengoi]